MLFYSYKKYKRKKDFIIFNQFLFCFQFVLIYLRKKSKMELTKIQKNEQEKGIIEKNVQTSNELPSSKKTRFQKTKNETNSAHNSLKPVTILISYKILQKHKKVSVAKITKNNNIL